MNQLRCKLSEYVILYSSKIMWGMDCDIDELKLEILKIQGYLFTLEVLAESNDCINTIPVNLIQKIESYMLSLNRRKNKTCRNCK